MADAPDPFNLESLILSPTYSDGFAVKKLITKLRILERPNDQDWLRVNPDPAYTVAPVGIIRLKTKELYLVPRDVAAAPELERMFRPYRIFTAITLDGETFLWAVVVQEEGEDNDYHTTKLSCAEAAMTKWVRLVTNQDAGYYETHFASAKYQDPEFLDMPFAKMLEIAFRGRIIDTVEHPVILRLRGLA